VDFDSFVAPSAVLIVALVFSGFCLHRIRVLSIKPYPKWRRICERIVLSLTILVVVAAGASAAFSALAIHHYRAVSG
jgi:hypothetical protein